ncbi:hypothetical protein [Williamwhitmania taraxaci]|uniref:Uncharacterized protein n=1 Tax=Williamwhitmania taraxaci TaxID=1640674 RepID=A0A1G6MDY4_9BACT|nr:hypothetical protein [Williamwhitmania taraxaci]SDC53661.1 hypothetical protein SAMN05216323_103550 [Williamwhitmania taraxaci]
MKTKRRNYSAFWALLGKMSGNDGNLKEQLVSTVTDGRTTSLQELSDKEYSELVRWMANQVGRFNKTKPITEAEREQRSLVLKLLNKLGVHTINDDWSAVNIFLLDPKIAGRLLYELDEQDLGVLIRKLNSIIDKNKQAGQLSYGINKISLN